MEKKYLNLIYSLYSLCKRILPLKNLVIKNSQKIAFFANSKTEFIFGNDGNVDTSQELIFTN